MKDVTIVVGTVGQSIMRSEDNGQTWARIGPRRGFAYEASVRCIAMNPKQHNILFAGTEKGLYRSEDRGANWHYIDSMLNPHYIWAIGIDPVNPNNIWASLEVDGTRHSSDGGETWEIVEVTGRKDIHNVAVTAGPPRTVFIMVNREIHSTRDNGKTWETHGMQTSLPWEYPRKETYLRGIAVDSANPKSIFLGFGDFTPGSSGAIARSNDLGKSWRLLPLSVEPNSTVWTFGTNSDDSNILFAASRYGYLYRSDDAGASWTKLRRELSEIAAVCWLPN